MHVLLGILGTIVTILILLNRLADAGIDLGGLNPFLWARRRKWRKVYEGDPKYKLTDPMEATALLAVAIAKSDGDISSEEKQFILNLFESEFKLSRSEATGLLSSSAHMIGRGDDILENVHKMIAPSKDNFTVEQARSAIDMFERVASINKGPEAIQQQIVDKIKKYMRTEIKEKGKWD